MERYERIGQRLMNRVSHGSAMQGDPIAAVLGRPGQAQRGGADPRARPTSRRRR